MKDSPRKKRATQWPSGPGPLAGLRLCQERRRGGAAPGQRRQGQCGGRRTKRGEKVGKTWDKREKIDGTYGKTMGTL